MSNYLINYLTNSIKPTPYLLGTAIATANNFFSSPKSVTNVNKVKLRGSSTLLKLC